MAGTNETRPFFPKVLEDIAWLIFEEMNLGLSHILMMERTHGIDHFLDFLHGVYLI